VDFQGTSALPPPSARKVKATEDYFRVEFPASFREFLERWNGATPKKRFFVTSEGIERRIERFLPLLERPADAGDDGWYDITVVHTQIEERVVRNPEVLGSDLVPIAELFAGDFVCLDFAGGGAAVVVWDHEQSEEFAPVVVPVAKDFESFLAMLRPS
jgi:hypothetical protein